MVSNNAAMNTTFNANAFTVTTAGQTIGAGDWYDNYWIPYNYQYAYIPYIQTYTLDRGKKALDIAKMLQSKKLVNLKTAKQFANLMDELISVL